METEWNANNHNTKMTSPFKQIKLSTDLLELGDISTFTKIVENLEKQEWDIYEKNSKRGSNAWINYKCRKCIIDSCSFAREVTVEYSEDGKDDKKKLQKKQKNIFLNPLRWSKM